MTYHVLLTDWNSEVHDLAYDNKEEAEFVARGYRESQQYASVAGPVTHSKHCPIASTCFVLADKNDKTVIMEYVTKERALEVIERMEPDPKWSNIRGPYSKLL